MRGALLGGPGDLVSGLQVRVLSTLNGGTLVITLLITDLLSPLGLQVIVRIGFWSMLYFNCTKEPQANKRYLSGPLFYI